MNLLNDNKTQVDLKVVYQYTHEDLADNEYWLDTLQPEEIQIRVPIVRRSNARLVGVRVETEGSLPDGYRISPPARDQEYDRSDGLVQAFEMEVLHHPDHPSSVSSTIVKPFDNGFLRRIPANGLNSRLIQYKGFR